MKRINDETRRKIVASRRNKLSYRQLSQRYGVSLRTVTRVLKEAGEVDPDYRRKPCRNR